MNLIATQYSLQYRALEIYLAGCKGPHCANCHTPETWDFRAGTPMVIPKFVKEVKEKVDRFGDMVDKIMILGGEPMDQPRMDLTCLLVGIKNYVKLPIWLFTRCELDDIPVGVLGLCDYIKTGRYLPECSPGAEYFGIKLASCNQQIHKKPFLV